MMSFCPDKLQANWNLFAGQYKPISPKPHAKCSHANNRGGVVVCKLLIMSFLYVWHVFYVISNSYELLTMN